MANDLEILKSTLESNLDAKTVIEFYGLSRNATRKYMCPFHNDKHPSLTVKGHKWKCWGCDAGGDIFDFVARWYNISFKDSILKLALDFGYDSTNTPDSIKKAHSERLKAQRRAAEEERRRKELVLELSEHYQKLNRVVTLLTPRPFHLSKWVYRYEWFLLKRKLDILELKLDALREGIK